VERLTPLATFYTRHVAAAAAARAGPETELEGQDKRHEEDGAADDEDVRMGGSASQMRDDADDEEDACCASAAAAAASATGSAASSSGPIAGHPGGPSLWARHCVTAIAAATMLASPSGLFLRAPLPAVRSASSVERRKLHGQILVAHTGRRRW
jgi:hypothetical protein